MRDRRISKVCTWVCGSAVGSARCRPSAVIRGSAEFRRHLLEDQEFHPKLGRLESRERAPRLLVAQVLAAARPAAHVNWSWPARSPAPGIPARAAAQWSRCVPQRCGYTVIVRAG